MAIDRPIFIVGPHRTGTTLLYELLVSHLEVGYLNAANRRLPCFPRIAHLVSRTFPARSSPPMEAPRFWDWHQTRDDDVMDARDASPRAVKWYRDRVRLVSALGGASRFLAKYPRLSLRLPWLDAVFPDAMFIHLTRDWRAVLSSTVERMVKRKEQREEWFGVRIPGWRDLRDLPPEEAAGRILVAVIRELELQKRRLKDRCLTVRYEDVCRDPLAIIAVIADWSGCARDPTMEHCAPGVYECRNWKWPSRLSPDEIKKVRSLDPDLFSRYE